MPILEFSEISVPMLLKFTTMSEYSRLMLEIGFFSKNYKQNGRHTFKQKNFISSMPKPLTIYRDGKEKRLSLRIGQGKVRGNVNNFQVFVQQFIHKLNAFWASPVMKGWTLQLKENINIQTPAQKSKKRNVPDEIFTAAQNSTPGSSQPLTRARISLTPFGKLTGSIDETATNIYRSLAISPKFSPQVLSSTEKQKKEIAKQVIEATGSLIHVNRVVNNNNKENKEGNTKTNRTIWRQTEGILNSIPSTYTTKEKIQLENKLMVPEIIELKQLPSTLPPPGYDYKTVNFEENIYFFQVTKGFYVDIFLQKTKNKSF